MSLGRGSRLRAPLDTFLADYVVADLHWELLLFGAALSLALPGAMIFFLLAPTLALAGIGLERRAPAFGTGLMVAAALLQLLMFAELLALIEMLLIDGPLWAVTPLAALATSAKSEFINVPTE